MKYLIYYTKVLFLIYRFIDTSGRGFAATVEDERKEGLNMEVEV